MERNKWNEFKEAYKNNLLNLNLFFYFILLHFFFPSTYPLYFLSFVFSLKFYGNQTWLKIHFYLKRAQLNSMTLFGNAILAESN